MSQLVNIDQTNLIIANIGATTKTLAQLNTDYPNAKMGQEVHSDTELYKKTSTGWIIMAGGAGLTRGTRQINISEWNAGGTEWAQYDKDVKTIYFFGTNASNDEFKFELESRYHEGLEPKPLKDHRYIFYNQSNKPIRIGMDTTGQQFAPYLVNPVSGENKFLLYPNETCVFLYDYYGDDLVLVSHVKNKDTRLTAAFTGTNANQSASFTPSVSGNYNILGGFLISKDSGWYTLFDFRKDSVSQLGWNRRCDDNPSNDAQGRQELIPINLVNVPLVAGSVYSLHVSMSTGVSTYNRLLGGQFSNLKIELA